jgi:hypothetical protein
LNMVHMPQDVHGERNISATKREAVRRTSGAEALRRLPISILTTPLSLRLTL